MPADCACRYEHLNGSRALVTAVGELDLNTCPQFKTALDAAARRAANHLLVDLSGVTYMDSTALGLLAAEQRRRAEPLHVVVTEPQLLRIMEVTGCAQGVRHPLLTGPRPARDRSSAGSALAALVTGARRAARTSGPRGPRH